MPCVRENRQALSRLENPPQTEQKELRLGRGDFGREGYPNPPSDCDSKGPAVDEFKSPALRPIVPLRGSLADAMRMKTVMACSCIAAKTHRRLRLSHAKFQKTPSSAPPLQNNNHRTQKFFGFLGKQPRQVYM